LRIARRLAQKLLGFRYYMDVISLDASLVQGTHGRLPTPGKEESEAPVFISSSRQIERDEIPLTMVKPMILDLQFG
ncbi:MAG: alkaline phosphatase family protein, partial [Planctomycetaceae bacterium]|nr:alkaline phosphatase family protein [Planctomycetaceae bacterium]